MKVKKLLICILITGIALEGMAQKVTLSGYLTDAATGEQLIGASVFVKDLKDGTATNVYGFYSLTLPQGTYDVVYSYVGYNAQLTTVALTASKTLNVKLEANIALEEVVITEDRSNRIQEKTQMSTITLGMDKVKNLPAFMGEKDVIKTLQLLPGVQSGGEGSSGLYVRGGGPDQNLILLDGVPVYNASHLFGFFSVFNADAINSVELIKGGFPSRYGGRLSSVVDIRMKEGNTNKFEGEGSVGIISSKLSLQGPIGKAKKTTFIVSGRRTYLDILARPIIKAVGRSAGEANVVAGYYFYDLNAKLNHKFSDRSRLYLSAYGGDDIFYFDIKDDYVSEGKKNEYGTGGGLSWGNKIAALRWNYMFSPKLFSNTTVTYSKYKFDTDVEFYETYWENDVEKKNSYYSGFYSGIDDITAKVDFDYMPSPKHFVKFGFGDIYHKFSPGASQTKFEFDGIKLDSTVASNTMYAHEAYAYIEDDLRLGNRLKVNLGLHATAFMPTDTTFYSLQPRIAARFLVSDKASIKASYATMMQALHLLTNPTIGLPTDLWVPATKNVPVEYSQQVALGYAQTVKDAYELSLEAYYKTMDNLIEYKDGQSFGGSDANWENKVAIGRGWSYGLELLFEKKVGKLSGWIGYTLSWTNRQFDDLNFGKAFPYRYDRRHDMSLVITYKQNDKVDFGLVWVYGTGNAYTLGLEHYWAYNDELGQSGEWVYFDDIEHVESRNNFRAPSYHRLDLAVNFHKPTKWGQRTISLGLYNAYSRQNPFFIYWGYEDGFFSDNSARVLKQVALFPMIPSISYAFKF
ncbi:MAG: TonB-dependent receptor [Bacteroidetes bacterium]|nr:TonB-dependent receptor [Bacteroidota bacterium]